MCSHFTEDCMITFEDGKIKVSFKDSDVNMSTYSMTPNEFDGLIAYRKTFDSTVDTHFDIHFTISDKFKVTRKVRLQDFDLMVSKYRTFGV